MWESRQNEELGDTRVRPIRFAINQKMYNGDRVWSIGGLIEFNWKGSGR